MSKTKKPSSGSIFLIVVLVVVSAMAMGLKFKLSSLASISYYQGVHPQFIGVYYEGQWYTKYSSHDASTCRIHPATLDFDPDRATWHKPNLQGELRDIQIVTDLSRYEVGDAYTHIINLGGVPGFEGPYKDYTWDIRDEEGLVHQYKMELWLCSFEVNLWANPDARGPLFHGFDGEQMNKKYSSAEVWLKLEVGPAWYFEGADETYFGLAYMELAKFSQPEKNYDPNVEVIPESKWACFSIYTSLGGGEDYINSPTSEALQYQGKRLNPEVFRKTWYTNIHLGDFGSFGYNIIGGGYNTHSVQLRVLVHCFVVGEWKVRPGEERDMEEHEATLQKHWYVDLWDWIKSPFTGIGGAIFGFIGLLIIIVVVVWILAPTFLWRAVGRARSSLRKNVK